MDITPNTRPTLERVTKALVVFLLIVTWENWRLLIVRHWSAATWQTHYFEVLLLILYPLPGMGVFMKHVSRSYIAVIAYGLLLCAAMIAFPH
jgi:hypothetical protein